MGRYGLYRPYGQFGLVDQSYPTGKSEASVASVKSVVSESSEGSEISAASEAPEKGRRLITAERRFLFNPLRQQREEEPGASWSVGLRPSIEKKPNTRSGASFIATSSYFHLLCQPSIGISTVRAPGGWTAGGRPSQGRRATFPGQRLNRRWGAGQKATLYLRCMKRGWRASLAWRRPGSPESSSRFT